jgi:putative Ca2+/H+ antiporter (TMEM165/GDT1 family)
MDWKIFCATFGAIFVAELADKTQMVGVCMSAKTGNFFTVWLGSIGAYIVVTTISVLLGVFFGKCISAEWIRYAGASVFIIIGFLMMFKVV